MKLSGTYFKRAENQDSKPKIKEKESLISIKKERKMKIKEYSKFITIYKLTFKKRISFSFKFSSNKIS